jgi:hypothetical protein
MRSLAKDLENLLNSYSIENASNTPDFILAEYMLDVLTAYNNAVQKRARWYTRIDVPGQGSVPFPYDGDNDD